MKDELCNLGKFWGFVPKNNVMDSLLVMELKIIFTNLGQVILSRVMIVDI
jgi:hypothetical protein